MRQKDTPRIDRNRLAAMVTEAVANLKVRVVVDREESVLGKDLILSVKIGEEDVVFAEPYPGFQDVAVTLTYQEMWAVLIPEDGYEEVCGRWYDKFDKRLAKAKSQLSVADNVKRKRRNPLKDLLASVHTFEELCSLEVWLRVHMPALRYWSRTQFPHALVGVLGEETLRRFWDEVTIK